MAITGPNINPTTPAPTPAPLRHDGPCGRRSACWRPACRAAWGDYRTVEVLGDGLVLAYCHGSRFRPIAYRPERAA